MQGWFMWVELAWDKGELLALSKPEAMVRNAAGN